MKKEKIHKILKSFNITSVLFFVMSCISISFAWFAFSNSTNSNVALDVSAWHIKIGENNSTTLHFDVSNFSPGMDGYSREVEIVNDGDLDAKLEYNITYLRIFNQEFTFDSNISSVKSLSHDYPFKFNFGKTSDIINSKSSGKFFVSITWPFDSLDNSKDTYWGEQAYLFQKEELEKVNSDSSYERRNDIELTIELVVSQNLAKDVSDNDFAIGKKILVNESTLKKCETENSTCISYNVLDSNNLIQDSTVKLININKTDTTSNLSILDFLQVISRDINNTYLDITSVDKSILGYVDTSNVSEVMTLVDQDKATITFKNDSFNYLVSDNCYYVKDSNGSNKYIVEKSGTSSVLRLNKQNSCKNVKIITIDKSNFSS